MKTKKSVKQSSRFKKESYQEVYFTKNGRVYHINSLGHKRPYDIVQQQNLIESFIDEIKTSRRSITKYYKKEKQREEKEKTKDYKFLKSCITISEKLKDITRKVIDVCNKPITLKKKKWSSTKVWRSTYRDTTGRQRSIESYIQ